MDEAFKKLSKYLSVTGVEEDKKPLQEIVVQQETEITNLRNRLDVVVKAGEKSREELDEMRQQLSSLASEVGQLASRLSMMRAPIPTKENRKASSKAAKTLEKEGFVIEK
ncbi:hypothetical protein MUO83_02995 [Candidatus Bathyarchaeota archaeon]|nr:hypothetical protein [Candidatus Bathyarchaeota archaeon]